MQELNRLRDDMAKGRSKEGQFVPEHVAPFLELILMQSGIGKENSGLIQQTAPVSLKLFEIIRSYLQIPNFWQKPSERRKLESELWDELEYCGIEALSGRAANLTTELINLAKNRVAEVLRANA